MERTWLDFKQKPSEFCKLCQIISADWLRAVIIREKRLIFCKDLYLQEMTQSPEVCDHHCELKNL